MADKPVPKPPWEEAQRAVDCHGAPRRRPGEAQEHSCTGTVGLITITHTQTHMHVLERVQVDDLKEKLAAQEVELKQKNDDADALIEKVGVEQGKVGKEKAVADVEEKKVAKINEDVTKKQQDCERDLAKAEPALKAAVAALDTLNKANLTELKSFGKPPPAVMNVAAGVMVLLASDKIPKDRSWNACKVMMAKVSETCVCCEQCVSTASLLLGGPVFRLPHQL